MAAANMKNKHQHSRDIMFVRIKLWQHWWASPVPPPGQFDNAVLQEKQNKLFSILRDLDRVLVAYSGGTDSAYLAWAAAKVLGDRAVAITADSGIHSRVPQTRCGGVRAGNRDRARVYRDFRVRQPEVRRQQSRPVFPLQRRTIHALRGSGRGAWSREHIIYGVNKDDLGDYRPGQNAARIHEVKAPLVEAELTKAEIRELSRIAGLRTWDRPASACLSSRVPYGTPVTAETVKTVESGEEAIELSDSANSVCDSTASLCESKFHAKKCTAHSPWKWPRRLQRSSSRSDLAT